MLNIHKSKPQCSNCPDTSVINSMAGKDNCSYQYFLERLLDRCIIRVVLKRKAKNHKHLSGLLQIVYSIYITLLFHRHRAVIYLRLRAGLTSSKLN